MNKNKIFKYQHYFQDNKIQIFCLLVLILFLSLSIFSISQATNRAFGVGYFTGKSYSSGRRVIKRSDSAADDGIPAWVNSKENFIFFIEQLYYGRYYYSGSAFEAATANDKIGADYIIQTMRGEPWDNNRPDNSDLADWKTKIDGVNYLNDELKSFSINTKTVPYSGTVEDVITYQENDTQRAIVFVDKNNSSIIYYMIKRNCGNPIGDLPGLPSSWTAEPKVSAAIDGGVSTGELGVGASTVTIEPGIGQTVRWHNLVRFANGSGPILYSGEKSVNWSGSTGPISINGDVGPTNHFSYTALASDAGKTFCVWTHIDHASPGGVDASSGQACAYVRPNWKITATTGVTVNGQAGKTQAKPGDMIVWNHQVKNDGPTYTTDFIISWLKVTGISGWSRQAKGRTEGGQGLGVIRTITDFATYKVTPEDVGKTLCEQVEYTRNDDKTSGSGNNVCIYIPYQYTLVPRIALNPSGVLEDGSSFTVNPSVENQGSTQSRASNWRLIERVYNPNGSVRSSTSLGSGSNVIFNPQSTTYTPSQNMPVVASGEVGTKYCYTLTVTPKSDSDNGPAEFGPICITIGKKPKVQVWGGNTISGGLISTSLSNKAGNLFGSWTEYGVFANHSITGMASGSAFSRPTDLPNPATACDYSRLSFTNVPSNASTCSGAVNTIGNYGPINKVLANLSASFPGNSAAGDITLSGSTLAAGKTVILKVNGTVTITGNQLYEDIQYMNSSQLPQLIIIANNINIQDNVTNIDAWLVASNTIDTCANIVGNLSASLCANQLIVNGPVSTNSLMLRRTAGSGTGNNSGNPAEIFNLRADTFLWAENFAKNNPKAQSVYLTELPPRF